jgi:hypothetical protein
MTGSLPLPKGLDPVADALSHVVLSHVPRLVAKEFLRVREVSGVRGGFCANVSELK